MSPEKERGIFKDSNYVRSCYQRPYFKAVLEFPIATYNRVWTLESLEPYSIRSTECVESSLSSRR